jgi:methylthioribose-1-phosphate isomerase
MILDGKWRQSAEVTPDGSLLILDQRDLPHRISWVTLTTPEQAATAITEMWTRGAPLIGIVAAFGLVFAVRNNPSDDNFNTSYQYLVQTRPTAINLAWALNRMRDVLLPCPVSDRYAVALETAKQLIIEDIETNKAIGRYGLELIKKHFQQHNHKPVNILTHCNAGWLATADWGTALAPIYMAHDAGIPVHVWVDETRPRNQGALLTAFELTNHGVHMTLITDNAGGHLMQHGLVDMCIVGADRVTKRGDVCNKIGTYLKALAAFDNQVPFYAAVPLSTFDHSLEDGVKEIPIEERAASEITHLSGMTSQGELAEIRLTLEGLRVANYGFDVTPARLVTGIITERGMRALPTS